MHKYDTEYLDIVKDVLKDPEFLKLKSFEHHGISRYKHSLDVSYQAYKLAKKRNMDYKAVAIGGLLHDFFESPLNQTTKERFMSTFKHSELALKNASNRYDINDKASDIIISHMFPLCNNVPTCKESWLVMLVDKKAAFQEFGKKFGYQLSYATNLMALIFLNYIK